MKLLRGTPTPETRAAVADCIAHRCLAHQELPPLNMQEGNGSSECGVCAAEQIGTRLAEQALELQRSDLVLPLLDGYADRLTHHAVLRRALQSASVQMELAGLDVNRILEVLADA